jgi:hypothetical protein
MSNLNIFSNSQKTLPKKDEQIIRIDFEKPDLVGKPPTPSQSGVLGISHVPNAGSKT